MDDKTAIHQAVTDGNYQEVRQLLRANRLLANAVGEQEATPLHKVANLEIAELLVSFGANVNAPGWMGDTPLHEAVRKDRFEIAQFLITRGANVRAVRQYDIAPLHWAKNAKMARLLIENGAAVSIKNEFGATPVHSAVEVGDLEFLNLLVEAGAKIDQKDNLYGRTPLHITSNLAIMRRLLELGANVNTPDRTGQTPVHKAAVRRDVGFLQLLLDRGADVTIRDVEGLTPLHLAKSKSQPANVEALEKYINANRVELHKIPEHLESRAVIANPRRSEAITLVDHAILARWNSSDRPQLLNAAYTEHTHIARFAPLPDGETFIIGTAGNKLQVRKWSDFAVSRTISSPSDRVMQSLSVSPDGRWIALGDAYEDVYLLDAASGKAVAQVDGGEVTAAISFSRDSRLIAIACSFQGGGHIAVHRLTEIGDLQLIYELGRSDYETSAKAFVDTLVDVTFSPNAKWLALFETSRIYHEYHADGWRGNLVVYSVDNGKLQWQQSIDANITHDLRPLNQAGYSSGFFTRLLFLNDETVMCGSADGKLLRFNVEQGKLAQIVTLNSSAAVIDLALDVSGTSIWAVLDNGELALVPVEQRS